LLAEFILKHNPEAVVKKIDTDSYLDIHIPSIHPKKGTHIFFNTSKQKIKIGFYCREEEFVESVLAKGGDFLEKYSQGVRLKDNPEFEEVQTALEATKKFIALLRHDSVVSPEMSEKKSPAHTFKEAVDAFLQGNLEYVAEYREAGNPLLQFNGDILITNELISYVCAFTAVNQRIVDLVESGVNLDESFDNGEGYTAVHYAAWDGKDEILAYLLDAGAEADRVGEDGYTPLLLAVAGGHQASVALLVERGADLNIRIKDANIYFSKQGGTPLTVSFINGYLETALYLIEQGADPFVLVEPCQNAPSPNLIANFLSLVKQGQISAPTEGQLSKILSLVGLANDENLVVEDSSTEDRQTSGGELDLNEFLKELDASDTKETEAADSEDGLDLASFLEGLDLEEADVSEESEEMEDEEEEVEEEGDELGYPMISWWGKNINQEQLENYAYKWQTKSEVYGWVMGISGFIPDWFEELISEKVCPAFSRQQLLGIANQVADEKIIPILTYAPEELFFHVKRVWWIVPFCIWKEDTASFVFIDKNGFYSLFKNKEGEVAINFIFPWDKVSSLEFETEYAADPNINRLTLFQDNGGFLTFDEFVGLGEDGKDKGSYLAVVESIWEARKDTIEASSGVPMWYEGKGGEGFKEFEKPQDLLEVSKWKNPSRPNPSMYGG
jgi:ankyrin repeat protein